MNLRYFAAAAVTLSLGAAGLATPAAAAKLYVTDGDSFRLAIVDTVTGTVSTVRTQPGQYPVAVSSSVWLGNYYGSNASEYDLAGSPTGNTSPIADVDAVDGTTDGIFNYELGNAFNSSATVYKANMDWTNPVSMFNVSGSDDFVGITFDALAGSLWVSSQSTVFQYNMTGTLLSQFNHSSGRGSLAYEQGSDTLWYVTNGSNTITQYSKSGTLLQTVNAPGLASNNWGAEFSIAGGQGAVPEPATWAMMIIGFGAAGSMIRRRKAVVA